MSGLDDVAGNGQVLGDEIGREGGVGHDPSHLGRTEQDVSGGRPGDFSGDEGPPPERRFVIEEDPVAGKHVVGLAVVHGDPVAVELGCTVRAAGVEGRVFVLGYLLDLAEELAGRRPGRT